MKAIYEKRGGAWLDLVVMQTDAPLSYHRIGHFFSADAEGDAACVSIS